MAPPTPANAVLSAVALAVMSAAAVKQAKKRGSRKQAKKTAPAKTDAEPEMLLAKLFGEDKVMRITVEVQADSAAADRETHRALRQVLALVLAVFAATCFMCCAVASGSFVLVLASLSVARWIAAPAACSVRKYWGRALDEALDESIKTTGMPWDLAII